MKWNPFKKKTLKRESVNHDAGSASYVPLYLLLTIVNDGQASSIVKIARNYGASASYVCHGHGTASNDFYEVFGLTHSNKQVVLTPIRSDMYPNIREATLNRFSINDASKGVAALLPISSVIGKNAYRLLADERVGLDAEGAKKLMENVPMKGDFELVVAIVNDSYTDLVMDAAKSAGARGGTILNARGTGNKDIENFFGVVITPEKQIVLIIVPKKIRDDVLSAIYKNVGLNSKGQGIVFSLPASDVLGVAEERPAEANEESNAAKESK